MGWTRYLAALGAAASLAAPPTSHAAPIASAGRSSGAFSVSAVVVRSIPVALRAAGTEMARAAAPGPRAAAPQAPRPIAVSGARTAPSAFPAGAHAAVVFIDGEPPSWTIRERPARAAARAELGSEQASR